MDKEKEKILKKTLGEIHKIYGEGSAMVLGNTALPKIARLSSGILPLDVILGGGYPVGRIVELYGPEGAGKTTICLKAIASAQQEDGICAFIDAEHALDLEYAKVLGVNVDELVVSQPDNGEMALEILEKFIRSGVFKLVVVDSVAALVPKAEIDGEMGDAHIGLHARLMSQAMRKLVGITNQSKCIVIFTNQIREKVGVMYGNPEVTTGGRALKYYASIRLDIRKKEAIKNKTEIIGHTVKLKTAKNRVFPPFKETTFNIIYGKGPDEDGCIIDIAIKSELVDKAGSWFTYNGERFHGQELLETYLHNNPDLYEALKTQVKDLMTQKTQGSTTNEAISAKNEPEEEMPLVTEF